MHLLNSKISISSPDPMFGHFKHRIWLISNIKSINVIRNNTISGALDRVWWKRESITFACSRCTDTCIPHLLALVLLSEKLISFLLP